MRKEYNTHLCTFMGREPNLKILMPYIEGALLNDTVDNYWFIDMTRKRSDHEYIKLEHKRLSELFPGRVHLHNSDERGKIIDDKDAIRKASESWEVFYKFLNRFKDNDVIAKCDDDIFYIDIETLASAFELRWKNKKPYIMHSNCINNGLTGYYQNIKGIWNDQQTSTYPEGGLTGCLFTQPEIACDHHKKFTSDLISDVRNIDKYKLGRNINFTDRISINFIFFNGHDRHEISKITKQDEYDISCKYPQREDRPNLIIGDFTTAHHTYGPQEPVMEKLGTYEHYLKLCDKIKPATTVVERKNVNPVVNKTTTIKVNGTYMMKAWCKANTYVLRDPETKQYISTCNVTPDGQLHTGFDRCNDITDACLFDVNINQPSRMDFTRSVHLVKTPCDDKHEKDLTFPTHMHFQDNYEKMQVVFNKQPTGKYVIRPQGKFNEYCLAPNDKVDENMWKNNPKQARHLEGFLFWDKTKKFEWDVISMQHLSSKPVGVKINRMNDFFSRELDETTATSITQDLPGCNVPREAIWMVNEYVHELIDFDNESQTIKLVSPDTYYLFYDAGYNNLFYGPGPDRWQIITDPVKCIKHTATGKYLAMNQDGWYMSDNRVALELQPNI